MCVYCVLIVCLLCDPLGGVEWEDFKVGEAFLFAEGAFGVVFLAN